MDTKRGPKLGDAASLWNFTASPGWTKEEANILRLCLMKYGVSAWLQIQATGLLPGKTVQQLSGQSQRLLGQQSLAPFAGLRVDVDAVRRDNDAKVEGAVVAATGADGDGEGEDGGVVVRRKNGLVVWCGPNPTREMREAWRARSRERYGLTEGQVAAVDVELERAAAAAGGAGRDNNSNEQQQLMAALEAAGGVEGADPRALPRGVVVGALLPLLRERLAALLRGLEEAAAAEAAGAHSSSSSSSHADLLRELRALAAEREREAAAADEGDDDDGDDDDDDDPPPPQPLPSSKARAAVISLTASASAAGAAAAPAPAPPAPTPLRQKPPPKKKTKKEGDEEDERQQGGKKKQAAAAACPSSSRRPAVAAPSATLVRGADVRALAAMGFSRERARDALAVVGDEGGGVDAAVAWLLASAD